MSIWQMDLEGFPPQWLDVADRFEKGATRLLLSVANQKEAETLRFEWYAFKRKMRQAEKDLPADKRMYPTLPRIRAEIGQLLGGGWVLRFALRDVCKSAQILESALALSDEEVSEMDTRFISQRKGE